MTQNIARIFLWFLSNNIKIINENEKQTREYEEPNRHISSKIFISLKVKIIKLSKNISESLHMKDLT